MSDPTIFVVHLGTETYFAAEEAVLVEMVCDDDTTDSTVIAQAKATGLSVPVLDRVVDFGPTAIREHFYFNSTVVDADKTPISDLTDEQLIAVADTALADDRIWEAFHAVLVDAVAAVRKEASDE